MPNASRQLATTIWDELQSTLRDQPALAKALRDASPISPETRRQELRAFQAFMDECRGESIGPARTRAQVVYQCYVCFIYLGDAWFKVLRKQMPDGSATKRCCKFLTDNPVRAFRNAIAHGNWDYLKDFTGLEFWARKGDIGEEPLSRFEVSRDDLAFWQALARCVAYCVAEVAGTPEQK